MLLYDPTTSIYQFDGGRMDLAREFRGNMHGPHSEELRRILHRMRTSPVEGRYVVVVIEPYREWALAQLSGERGVAPLIIKDTVYRSLAEAEWEIFKLRWAELSGVEVTV